MIRYILHVKLYNLDSDSVCAAVQSNCPVNFSKGSFLARFIPSWGMVPFPSSRRWVITGRHHTHIDQDFLPDTLSRNHQRSHHIWNACSFGLFKLFNPKWSPITKYEIWAFALNPRQKTTGQKTTKNANPVTLYDPTWHVTPRDGSSKMRFLEELYTL